MKQNNILVLREYLQKYVEISDMDLFNQKERHKYKLNIDSQFNKSPDWCSVISDNNMSGVIIWMDSGMPGKLHLKAANKILKHNKKLWFYWDNENAIEFIDLERLSRTWMLWYVINFIKFLNRESISIFRESISIFQKLKYCYRIIFKKIDNDFLKKFSAEFFSISFFQKQLNVFAQAVKQTNPNEFSMSSKMTGVYLRFDYWAKISAGGSYGHTCFVAKELSKYCDNFHVFMPHEYDLMHKLGLNQVELGGSAAGVEPNIIASSERYYEQLVVALKIAKPDFIYERIVLGNYAGAKLANELKIPYIVEYNGSEIAMKRSYTEAPYEHESYYLEVEKVAFQQATAINVISQVVADQLIKTGVAKEKILVNPNGVDPTIYKPAKIPDIERIRLKYNWSLDDVVIGFIGTFGDWHGIDILAEAIPTLCKANSHVKFLLIGDGNLAHLIQDTIKKYKLEKQVVLTGIVAQADAVELLQACDMYVAPHSAKRIANIPFFGSPTKLFEYMALGKGIVASNLMQMGEVLQPALYHKQLPSSSINTITNERGILCEPGNVQQFVDAVQHLIDNPEVVKMLGANARKAACEIYSWKSHVARLMAFLNKEDEQHYLISEIQTTQYVSKNVNKQPSISIDFSAYEQSDKYKKQVQNQWDNNPCGSHYVKNTQQHTLEWFLEAEKYRYEQYAPWMEDVMGFDKFKDKHLLEVGGGMGTDLAQFAKHGAFVTDLDLSKGHLCLAAENFQHRGLSGEFKFGDAENMPFPNHNFDVIYSNGVIHHSPNTEQIVREMYRVLKPGGSIKIMVYAENSINFWYNQVYNEWWKSGLYQDISISELMSRRVEITENDAKPLVKVYTAKQLKKIFSQFENINIVKHQLTKPEVPKFLKWVPFSVLEKLVGWNLILTASKPLDLN